jgi:DNA-binding transcriptional regulator/RsmH inhibitor MraZ
VISGAGELFEIWDKEAYEKVIATTKLISETNQEVMATSILTKNNL